MLGSCVGEKVGVGKENWENLCCGVYLVIYFFYFYVSVDMVLFLEIILIVFFNFFFVFCMNSLLFFLWDWGYI